MTDKRLITPVRFGYLYRIRNRETGLCYVMPGDLYNVLYHESDFDLVEKMISSAHKHEIETEPCG